MSQRDFVDNAGELSGSFRRGRKSGNLDEFSGRIFDVWDFINLPGVTLAPNNLMSRPQFQRLANIAFNNMPPGMVQGTDLAINLLLKVLDGVVRNYNSQVVASGKGSKGKSSAKSGVEPGKYFGE